ncbi:hypothetical protein KM043_007079 [Ampulex compressa]|nr:hypothetical protein KM043_007079 [Ampulex compressa]
MPGRAWQTRATDTRGTAPRLRRTLLSRSWRACTNVGQGTRVRRYITVSPGGREKEGWDISDVETDVDKQTCRRPQGDGKHRGVGVGGAVKREIHVHPQARFSIVRPPAFVEARIATEIDLSER